MYFMIWMISSTYLYGKNYLCTTIMVLSLGKTWADWSYIQNVLCTFLVYNNKIINKQAVFFALFFSNIFSETLENKSDNVNIETLEEFLKETRSFNIARYYKASMLLMSEEEYIPNDVISEQDFQMYKDILLLNAPYEIRKGLFGVVDDSTFTFKFRKKLDITPDELKELIPECINSMLSILKAFYIKENRYLYTSNLGKILTTYEKLKAKVS